MSTPTATSTHTDKDARPSGASIRRRVVGGATGPRTAPGDPFLAPFFETATEHVWGGVWNRPGLELKYRSLVVVSVLAATGHTNEELKTHLRGALNLGWTVDELREALLQIGGYAGFPAACKTREVPDLVKTLAPESAPLAALTSASRREAPAAPTCPQRDRSARSRQ